MAWPYTYKWQKYRKEFLVEHPFCKCGKVATVVDHIKPHKLNMFLFWDPTNHEAKCKTCHDAKTAGQDGGFGNETRTERKISGGCDINGMPTDPGHPWLK